MGYRDISAALERIERLEAEIAELRGDAERRATATREPIRWLDLFAFSALVGIGGAAALALCCLLDAR